MTSSPSEPKPDPRLPGLVPLKPIRFPTVIPSGPAAMAVMVLSTLVVIGAFFALGHVGAKPTEAVPEGPGGAGPDTDILPRKPQLEVLGPAELAAILPEETRDELQKELKTWFQADHRRPIDDRSGADETEWVSHLLSDEVLPRLERLPGHVFGELQDTPRVLDEPGPHRGTLVTVWGRVVSIDTASFLTDPETPAWRVRIDDGRGHPWTVTCISEPPPSVVPGGWARAFGVFTKLYPCEAKRPSFGLLTPQTIVRSYPPFEAKSIDPAWKASVRDATIEDSLHKAVDEEAFWKLCAYVRDLGTEGYRAKVAAGEIRVLDASNSRTLTALVNDPGPHRFEAIRLRAAPAQREFGVESGLDENPGHVKAIYRGYVVDGLHRPIWVVTPFPASQFSFDEARLVEVEGFFYKRIATEGESGNMYWRPLVVVTSIVPVEFGSTSRIRWDRIAVWVVAAGALFLAVVWVRVVLRSRREAAAARQRHLERMSKRKGGAEATA